MELSKRLSRLALLLGACAITLPTPPAHSQGKGKGKAKDKQYVEEKGKHGREAGELPFGLEQLSEKKGLPTGLQKKKVEDGSLTRGLEEGGKGLKPTTRVKKGRKS
jgi:hypothetical protein